MDFLEMITKDEKQLIQYRRHFHEYPELSGVEYETKKTIIKELKKMKIEYVDIKDGGILGFIGNKELGKTILLRGDIDALPVKESEKNLRQKKVCLSKVEGVSHSCGHDCHAAMLLMEGKLLKSIEDQLNGRVILCFEQGEEGTGNFKNILAYMDRHGIVPDTVYAVHVRSALDAGLVSFEPNYVLAGAFGFDFTLEGQGGHGSRPDLSNSPIDCFVTISEALNVLRMKYVSPFEPLAFSIGMVQAGNKANVIPSSLSFGGTCRYFNIESAKEFRKKMFDYVESTAKIYNLKCSEDSGYAPGIGAYNEPKLAKKAQEVVKKYLGKEHLAHTEPWMASETFSMYLDKYGGVLGFVGIKNDELGSGAEHHNSDFDVDESGLKYGVATAVAYAYEYLNDKN